MTTRFSPLLSVVVLLGAACTDKPQEKAEAPTAAPTQPGEVDAEQAKTAAIEAARAWLALIDAGSYAESHAASAYVMRTAVPAEQWDATMKGVRAPLGALQAREVASAAYSTRLPGAPDGHYVVIQFKTRFANKEAAVETVTPARESDGRWRVSGYYIR